jgi:two-component system, sensor histidine kinase PdtaS
MKKAMLIGCFILTQLLCCLSFVLSQRSPETINRLIQESKPDTGRVRIFLEAAMSYVLRPGSLPADMDTAKAFVDKALQLNSKVGSPEWEGKSFFVYSNIYREENSKEKGKQYAQKAIEVLAKSGKKIELANSYVELARYYDPYIDADLAEKIKLNELAALLFGEAGNKNEQANTIRHLGDLSILNGNFQKASIQLKEAIKIFKEINYKELQGVYDLLANASRLMGNYTEALQYGLLALKTAEIQKDSSAQLSTIYNHLGATLYFLDKHSEAANYYEKGVQVTLKNKDTSATVIIVHNLANAYMRVNETPKAISILRTIENDFSLQNLYDQVSIYTSLLSSYTEIKRYDSAKIYFNKLLDISTKKDAMDPLQADIYSSFVKYLTAVKRYTDVIKYCSLNEALCFKYGFMNKVTVMNYQYWYKADSALGRLDSALIHYQKLVTLNDSLLGEAKARQISELEIQYATEKKDNDIQLLTKQDQLQKKELRQASVLRNVTLAAVALLIIVLILLYNRFRLKQKVNHQLEIKQQEINQKNQALMDMLAEKEWWLKEVHHRVKNNLHTIICLLESQAMYLEKDALQAIEKSQHRIYAMSLIHQKLYQNEDLQVIDMSVYLEEFMGYLKDSFDAQKIDFILQVDPVFLNLQQAIPVALIINEGVTNSIKYAFGSESQPAISIFMTETGDTVKLIIMDNGRGFELKAEEESKSLGMQLIRGLSKELRGSVKIETHKGTTLTVEFKKGPLTDQTAFVQETTSSHEA